MGKVKKWLNDLSIRKSFALYMLFFMLLATVLGGLALKTVDIATEKIRSSYFTGQSERYYLTTEEGKRLGDGAEIIEKPVEPNYSAQDKRKLFALGALQEVVSPLAYLLCIGAAAMLFYRNKLRPPLSVLHTASQKITANDLDFSVEYSSKDEMGRLCASFEKMRGVLEKNNRELWRSVEERKRLNAAFTHDLRTPLTVLRGYAEFLSSHLEEDKLPKEKVMSTIHTMGNQIGRLESYVQNVNGIQKLEEIEPHPQKIALSGVLQAFRETADIVRGEKLVCFTPLQQAAEMIAVDLDLVLQVFENLMSNAARYADNRIDIAVIADDKALTITVADDGRGFSREDIHKAADPFYRADDRKDAQHFGLGLYICKIICEKHQGQLLLSNGPAGGASIGATFHAST
ncbi:HAMP domain-containing sensor histidine kinase [Paenibacillus sp. BAC0078]